MPRFTYVLPKDNIIISNINKGVCCRVSMQQECPCGHKWDYEATKIKNPLYCTCPRCNAKLRLREGQG